MWYVMWYAMVMYQQPNYLIAWSTLADTQRRELRYGFRQRHTPYLFMPVMNDRLSVCVSLVLSIYIFLLCPTYLLLDPVYKIKSYADIR